jgi:hypothetical protein
MSGKLSIAREASLAHVGEPSRMRVIRPESSWLE